MPTVSLRLFLAACLVFACAASAQSGGIPVTDDLVVAKCGRCHARDAAGIMDRISWERTTPEGWQDVLKRMIVLHDIPMTAPEARAIVKYLTTNHGLAPMEAKPIQYDAERRVQEETAVLDAGVQKACSSCHGLAKPLSWRRSPEDWKLFGDEHARQYRIEASEAAFTYFSNSAPLVSPEWTEWSSKPRPATQAGRWLLTASLPGRGRYVGEMQMQPVAEDEFNTIIRMASVEDGSVILRTGRSAVYTGYAWRGRSKGNQNTSPIGDPLNEAREVMWFSPGNMTAEGRWFWGQYQEFGFDVQLRRPAPGPTLLSAHPAALKPGSSRVRLLGDNFPATLTPAEFDLGPGVTVTRVVSVTAREISLDVVVTPEASLGKHTIRLAGSMLSTSIAIYDHVDYIAVIPDSTLAAFADAKHPTGYRQFAANAFQRGADNKNHTADDLDLGSVPVTWSLEVFYDTDGSRSKLVGEIDSSGLFTPATKNPNQNFDVWAIATAIGETARDGKPLVGKSYLVVTIATYTFNGRRYVRDLGRWVDDGPATP